MSAAEATRRAAELARRAWVDVPPDGRERSRWFAVGDPQASLDTVFQILDRYGLLGQSGTLLPDVRLVSIGDHFDFGGSEQRLDAAADGLAILSWLAAHPPDQVALVLGNHDLGRVGELASFDDETFALVHARAVEAYRSGDVDAELERRLCQDYPVLPTAELAARDFAAFSVAQRELVTALLRARRFRLAVMGPNDWVLSHAGVTRIQLDVLGLSAEERADGRVVVSALEERLDAAVESWRGEPFAISELHRPGDRSLGEGAGMLYHRPANPELPESAGHDFQTTLSRRFDPRGLPRGLCQVVGHVGDSKCRELLGPWADSERTVAGEIRHLVTDGTSVRYRAGELAAAPGADVAAMVFIDGHMSRTEPHAYRLLELSAV